MGDGVWVFWRETGREGGPPVVWIHGGSVEDSSYVTDDLAPFLGSVRGLFPDVRGHGRSSKFDDPAAYTYAKKSADLIAWLDHLGIEQALWGGVSMGGALALWTAAHAPGRVSAVISISGPPFAPRVPEKDYYAAHRHLIEAGDFTGYFDANVRRRMGEQALARLKSRPQRYEELTAPLREHSVASLLALLDETYSRPDWSKRCRSIGCPTLIIGGSEDQWPTREMTEGLAALIPAARLYIVEGGPHFPNRSRHRDEVQRVIGEFFAQVGVLPSRSLSG